jgi:hypothetical protein
MSNKDDLIVVQSNLANSEIHTGAGNNQVVIVSFTTPLNLYLDGSDKVYIK